ncbi:MAG: shikimate dehydrogenase [Anaerolineae bacterium]|jgi:shikimate dehydrogenase|nr:shikimate dehydrogenase [Anaerolineae bacterium]
MTQRVGIIGWPLTTTFSPAMHNAAFQALGMDWVYDKMAIPLDIVRLGILEPQRHGYVGINVTIPHKEEAMRYVVPDALAQMVGAVNTIDLRTMGGTNTDVAGLVTDLQANGVELAGKRAVILGAGGAARAAVVGLTQAGASVVVVNRSLERARAMVANLALSNITIQAEAQTLDDAVEQGGIDLIINATPAGMFPDVEATPWINGVPFPRGVTVYDMIYRPAQTRLMRQAEEHGGRAIGGLGMLVYQGAAAFKLWTGVEPPVEVMFAAVRGELGE